METEPTKEPVKEVLKAGKSEIDQYAQTVLRIHELEKILKGIRPSIEALGVGTHAGMFHALVVAKVHSSSLSVAIAKSLLTPAEIAQATIESDSIRITVDY